MHVQIFAFSSYLEFQRLLEAECRELTGHKPIIHTRWDELRSIIEIMDSVDILIIDEPEDSMICHEMEDFLVGHKEKLNRVLILGDRIRPSGNIKSYPRVNIDELFSDLITSINPNIQEHDGWTSIPLSTLVHFQSLPFDLYMKISLEKYIKRIPAHEELDKELILSFKNRGIRDLYCEKKYNRDFSMMLINNMVNRIEQQHENLDMKNEANNEVFLTTKEIIQHLGISSRVIEVCESTIERITQDVTKKNDQLALHILSLKNNSKLSFHFKLVELTSFICGQIVAEMKLPDIYEQVQKLVFASFFCDMCLSRPEFIHIRKSEATDSLTVDDYNEVNLHALKAAELVSSYKKTTGEVIVMIRQHHGSLSGIGFPDQRSSELLMLSKVFIVSQDLAYEILSGQEKTTIEVLRNFVKRHENTGLQELLNILEGSLRKSITEKA